MSAVHRQIVTPPWFDRPKRGVCRWCNKPIDKAKEPRRQTWHKACSREYWSLWNSISGGRDALAKSGGFCALCGAPLIIMSRQPRVSLEKWSPLIRHRVLRKLKSPAWAEVEWWEHDHIIPLADALPHADDPNWMHRLANRQALCPPCHRAKTARENSRRAAARRRHQAQLLGLLFPEAA